MEILTGFREPALLALLVVPVALCLWTWSRRGRALVLPFDHTRARTSRWVALPIGFAETLPPLLLGVVIVILAGPQAWGEPRSKRVLTNIQFCVDVSGSMNARFGDGTRYEGAMDAINAFLDKREGDAFGLTFFGNNVLHWVPLTTDVSAFRCAPPFMRPGHLPSWFGGTEIGKALLQCREVLLEREEGDRLLVLVTDGQSSDLGGGRDVEIARQLANDGITVCTVHVAEGTIPDQVVRIASITGGEAFKSEDAAGLDRVFARIDQMKRARMERSQAEATDDYRPWALGGLAALALWLLLSLKLRYTPW